MLLCHALSFQFQSGAIKREGLIDLFKAVGRFQFQSGAIKRLIMGVATEEIAKFQFQSGAIKRPRPSLFLCGMA